MADDKIFRLKELPNGKLEEVENKQKTISPHNSAKTLKYAKLPALCNDCIYRSIDDGGNGNVPNGRRMQHVLYEQISKSFSPR